MSSIISKTLPYFKKLSIVFLTTLFLAACGGGSSGSGDGGLAGLSDDFSLAGPISQQTNNDGVSEDITVSVNNNGNPDTQSRKVIIKLVNTPNGVIGSLSANKIVTEKSYTMKNGTLTFTIYRTSNGGDGAFTVAVLDEDQGTAFISNKKSYTIGAQVIVDTEDGLLALSLNLVEQADGVTPLGTSANPLAAANPGILQSTVSLNGAVQEGQIVTFSSNLGVISPSTDLTGATGLAEVNMTAGDVEGADVITATTQIGEEVGEATLNFQTLGDDVAVVTPSSYSMNIDVCNLGDNSLPCTSYGEIGNELSDASGDATVVVDIDDADGGSVEGMIVAFSLEGQIGSLEAATALTDVNGIATVTLGPGGVLGGGRVIATAEPAQGITLEEFATFQSDGDAPDAPAPFVFTLDSTINAAAGLCDSPAPAACVQIGESGNPITDATPGYIRAVLEDQLGNPIEGERVDFSLETDIGTVRISSSITDANGLAEGSIGAGDTLGAGTIIATVSPATGVTLTDSLSFATAGDSLAEPDPFNIVAQVCDSAIVIGGGQDACTAWGTATNPITVANQGYAWATVESEAGTPQGNILVTFSLANSFGTLETLTGLTDADGQVSVGLRAGVDAGAGTVTAEAEVGACNAKSC